MRTLRLSLVAAALLAVASSASAVGMPDLTADQTIAQQTVGLEMQAFRPGDCELTPVDQCVNGPGARKLLRFTLATLNVGTADLVIGDPSFNVIPEWTFLFSPCHAHFHFLGFSEYALHTRGQDNVVVAGRKQSFCIEDTHPWAAAPPPQHYGCYNQGLTVGWSDHYDRSLPCQWIDVTDVPPGDYDLRVNLNPNRLLPESDFSNNTMVVPVTIPADRPPAAYITVRPVNGGAALRSGDAVRLRWRRRYLHGRVRYSEIWLSQNDGATYDLVDILETNRRHFDWVVPPVPATTTARVKIVVWSEAMKRGTGISAPITIQPASGSLVSRPTKRIRRTP